MDVAENVRLDAYTTFQIGGRAEYFVSVNSVAELQQAVQFAHEKALKLTILGGGSNVLVSDDGVPGLVILNNLKGITYSTVESGVLVRAEAGEVFDDLVEVTVAKGYWGLENLSHIPGSVGAAPIQNIGAYGVEVKDVIESVTVYDIGAQSYKTLSAAACQFGYRHSYFKTTAGSGLIVTAVTFLLTHTAEPRIEYRDLAERFGTDIPSVADIRAAVIDIRSKKFPDWKKNGTAGSFFKNPIISAPHYDELCSEYPDLPGFSAGEGLVKVPLGFILDKVCNLKGYEQGGVGTYKNQALVLLNHGGATARSVTDFAEHISAVVAEKTGINIEWEVTPLPK